jgi:hypothetical protein
MGVVYKARQKSLGRIVALKMILPGMLGSDSSVRRFYQEAQAAGALDHPGIVQVYEVGEHQGRHFFTMAFVEGPSLTAFVRAQGLLPLPEALRIATAVAEAVEHAHQRSIVHRDLKPDNILLDADGRARILDFGLSKQIGEGQRELTRTGQVMGTPSYMAPEQATGHKEDVGPPTDVFALGGVLNFLLTGHPPFAGDSIPELLYKVVHEPPVRPRAHIPSIPPAVEEVCLRCLDKDPARRFATAGDLARALKSVSGIGADSVAVMPPDARPRQGRRRVWLAAAVVVLLSAAAVGGYLLFPGRSGKASEEVKDGPASVGEAAPGALAVGPLRRDFSLTVRLLGARPGEKGFRLRAGSGVRVQVEVDQDAHVGIWTVEDDGVIVQLFPYEQEGDTLVKAGVPRTIPDPAFPDFVAEPGDRGHLHVVASTAPLEQYSQKILGRLTFKTADEQKALNQAIRGLRHRPMVKIADDVIPYTVVPTR